MRKASFSQLQKIYDEEAKIVELNCDAIRKALFVYCGKERTEKSF